MTDERRKASMSPALKGLPKMKRLKTWAKLMNKRQPNCVR
jgi:hypothetical protein